MRRLVRRLRALAAPSALAAASAGAQQTIINVPSVDQTPRGRVFFLHESQVRDWGGESYWQTTHFLTYGLTRRVELAATVYNVGTPLKRAANVGVGWKAALPLAERGGRGPRHAPPHAPPHGPDLAPPHAPGWRRWEPTLGAGQMVPVSLRGEGAGLWSYAQASVRLPGLGTRLTGGVSNGPPNLFGRHTTHFIGSYEQPLGAVARRLPGRLGAAVGHMSLLGEWWSGRHELADFVPGVNYHHRKLVVILGYKLGNAPGTRGDGVIVEIGRTF
jgi:hypothetical protein